MLPSKPLSKVTILSNSKLILKTRQLRCLSLLPQLILLLMSLEFSFLFFIVRYKKNAALAFFQSEIIAFVAYGFCICYKNFSLYYHNKSFSQKQPLFRHTKFEILSFFLYKFFMRPHFCYSAITNIHYAVCILDC